MNSEFLMNTSLFRNMNEAEIKDALDSLKATEKSYKKGEYIFYAGDTTDSMALVLDGNVTIENNDAWGNHTVLNSMGKGHLFAETYALLDDEPLLVDVVAQDNCSILFLRIGSIKILQNRNESWTKKLMSSLLVILSHRSLALSGRSFHTAPKTIRSRVMSYLNAVSIKKHYNEFDIPFDRQQLADYLGVERSALSKELGKMRDDGIISVKKNHFKILVN